MKQIDVGLNLLPAMLSGSADAMLGGFRNVEGVDLRERGKRPDRSSPSTSSAIPTYDELVLVASEERIAEDPEPIRLFIAALEQGTRAAVAEPAAASEAVLERRGGPRPEADHAPRSRRRCPCCWPAAATRSATWTPPSGSASPASLPTAA